RDGIATVNADLKTSCNSCSAKSGCGSAMLNRLGPKNAHIMTIVSVQPLVPGQRVELGITENSLLVSAVWVYLAPLVGLFTVAGLFQSLFQTDVAAVVGAVLGGMGGFIVAKGVALYFANSLQPVILSVSLPPDTDPLRIEIAET
ncbi:SoxR reducing system RseC family protein, partial [Enterobacteriaceae bacterium LUAb1]